MTVLSIDRLKPRTTKLDRLSARANNHKDTVFNNLGHIIDEELLKVIYRQMNGSKAVGIDNVTKEMYGSQLDKNICNLITRIRRGTYWPQASRLAEIPKEDGSTRPLAISCFEDKLVQSAVSIILTEIYEPLFLSCSYGFRPNLSCHDALRALKEHTYPCWQGAVVEIDIRKYFNSIPHQELNAILQKKITDRNFLTLIEKLTLAPTRDNGITTPNTVGCPQGSIISPILANIYLHEVIDSWFNEIKKTHFKGKAEEVRYADDMVFVFQNYAEAKRFFEVLPKRLSKFGLDMHGEKSHLIRSGQNVAEREHKIGRRLPTYQFLGFTVYWGKARNGKWWRMKYMSRRDRFTSKLKGLKAFLRNNLNTSDTVGTIQAVIRVVVGWMNYHAVSDNERKVESFLWVSRKILFEWLNRRGRKRPMTWKSFNRLMERLNFPGRYKTISMFPKRAENG